MKNYQLLSITRHSPIKGDTYNIIEFEHGGQVYEYRSFFRNVNILCAESLIEAVLENSTDEELESCRVQEEEKEEPTYAELLRMLHQRKVTLTQ